MRWPVRPLAHFRNRLDEIGSQHAGAECAFLERAAKDGARSHTSALYEIQTATQHETQSSSGLIISTGLGSTAWFKSIVTGSLAIAKAFGEPLETAGYSPWAWDAGELQFAVREPFPSKTSQTKLVCGRLRQSEGLRLRSLMPENGVIFSDGIEADRPEFNSGTEARITVAERQGKLVI